MTEPARAPETFEDVIRAIIGNRTQRQVAKVAGISHAYLNDWLQGRTPARELLVQCADAWEAEGWLWPELRERLFRAAGYYDPKVARADTITDAPTYQPVYKDVTVKAFERGRDLPEGDQQELDEVFRLMIEQRRRARGLD